VLFSLLFCRCGVTVVFDFGGAVIQPRFSAAPPTLLLSNTHCLFPFILCFFPAFLIKTETPAAVTVVFDFGGAVIQPRFSASPPTVDELNNGSTPGWCG
jgi:hypothetical protein